MTNDKHNLEAKYKKYKTLILNFDNEHKFNKNVYSLIELLDAVDDSKFNMCMDLTKECIRISVRQRTVYENGLSFKIEYCIDTENTVQDNWSVHVTYNSITDSVSDFREFEHFTDLKNYLIEMIQVFNKF